MKYIEVKKANCKNCYKCLRNCPVKSIKYKENQVEVLSEECILCGKCIAVCPQKAKTFSHSLEKVKELVKNHSVYVSLAPSYIGVFGIENKNKLITALKKLGFTFVEETAVGARLVTNEYIKLMQEQKQKYILSTCCPTANDYITKYYPELIPYLAPVLSPMLAHGKLLKQTFGEEIKTVFIGPCYSKYREAMENEENWIDEVLNFKELEEWLTEEGIILEEIEEVVEERNTPYSSIYPISEGIILDIKKGIKEENNYQYIGISGIENLKQLFIELREERLPEKCFIEMNACFGSCINGPAIPEKHKRVLEGTMQIRNYADSIREEKLKIEIGIQTNYEKKPIHHEIPDEKTIREILSKIGKPSEEYELNCGSCGYSTCREKAIAVYQGKAELYMCTPYMSDLSQSLSNVTINASPNYIIAVDENMKIIELNLAAQHLFHTSRKNAIDKFLFEFMDHSDFEEVFQTKKSMIDKKIHLKDLKVIGEQSIIYVPEQNIVVGIIKDITKEEAKEKSIYHLKMETMEMAQKVIDKQMMVAQEIASLLGETTAETKVTLNKLKNLIIYEGQDENEK